MSMIRMVAHREERVVLGFDFAGVIGPEDTVTRLEAIRVEREDGTDVTDEIFELGEGGALPEYDIQGSTIVIMKRRVEPKEEIQLPDHYYVHIAARSSANQEPMVLDVAGRVPVLTITDGRRPAWRVQ